MSKLSKMLSGMFFGGKKEIADTLKRYGQAPGEIVTLNSEMVSVEISEDNSEIEIKPAAIKGRKHIGGEEIRPGTLHNK